VLNPPSNLANGFLPLNSTFPESLVVTLSFASKNKAWPFAGFTPTYLER
jgi:hypothetical protein